MSIDIQIYIGGTVNQTVKALTKSDSPLEFQPAPEEGYCFLKPKRTTLEDSFYCGAPDAEIIQEKLHRATQTRLGFAPRSELLITLGELTPAKFQAIDEVLGYITANRIPHYTTATNDEGLGEEILLGGINPLAGKTITSKELLERVQRQRK